MGDVYSEEQAAGSMGKRSPSLVRNCPLTLPLSGVSGTVMGFPEVHVAPAP